MPDTSPALPTDSDIEGLRQRHDQTWWSSTRRDSLERIAGGLLVLTGMFVLSWDAAALALFILAGFVLRAGGDWVLWTQVREQLQHELDERDQDDAVLAVLKPQQTEPEQSPTESEQETKISVGQQLAVSIYFVLALIAAILYELNHSGGIDLLAWARNQPTALSTMLLLLGLQLYDSALLARRARHHGSRLYAGSICFTPIWDMLLYFALMFLWIIGTALGNAVAEVFFSSDFRPYSLHLFVAAHYSLSIWRGAVEWLSHREVRAQIAALD